MVSKEEICGVIDAIGALTQDEISSVIKELSLLRGDTPLSIPEVKSICEEAEKEHLIVSVSWEEVEGVKETEDLYYISGPNAFPEVPFELSEVIDILVLSKRGVDLSKVALRLNRNLHKRINNLENKIDSVCKGKVHPHDLENLEHRYSDILNQYYDYNFWLSEDMSELEGEIGELSNRIEALRSAQGI
ncbi:DUF7109 family protein [Methanolobus profundi]|uniref:Uncharacterized protein n=1 Tax=Methanolobus profundi TaxID=487685 RepID=A0A1I4UUH1_9EURY|nr:hypothetical protein [Methanolobus profundi]SFM92622.1 hypothetical protein SAMN04488696_2898 [Methanolobus profundi]